MQANSSGIQNVKLQEESQIVVFLEDEPYASFGRHWVESGSRGERRTNAYICAFSHGDACPLCDEGNRPQSVSAFNVGLIGDDGEVVLRSLDVGPRMYGVLKSYATDAKIGPLTKGYYAMSKRGVGKNTTHSVIPLSGAVLEADYDVEEPSGSVLEGLGLYTADDISITPQSELRKAAESLDDYSDYR